MAANLHQVTFRWPYKGVSNVVVTGTFDGWSGSVRLTPTASGFEGTARVPWGEKVAYKYIVDGYWTTTDDQPTEYDAAGNLNNIYLSPSAPAPPPPEPAAEPSSLKDTIVGLAESVKQTTIGMVEAMAPGTTSQAPETPIEPASDATPKLASPPLIEAVLVVAAAPAEAEPASEPAVSPAAGEPEPPTPEPTEVAPEAILPPPTIAQSTVAPVVPIPVLPLMPKPPTTLIVEGTATFPPSPPPPTEDDPNGPSTHSPAVSKVAESSASVPATGAEDRTAIINGDAEPETVAAPAAEAQSEPEPQPETTNGHDIETPAPAVEKAASEPQPAATNGHDTKASASAVPAAPAPTASGAEEMTKTNGSTTPPSVKSSSPPASPNKKMRFPSISTRHSRRSSSSLSTSVNEFGAAANGEKIESRKDTISKPDSQRKKRHSIFGKIRSMMKDSK